MYKVEAIAAWGHISQNLVSLDVLEDEMHVLVSDSRIWRVHVFDG